MINLLLRSIPKTDELILELNSYENSEKYSTSEIKKATVAVLQELREGILSANITEIPTRQKLIEKVFTQLQSENIPSLRPVINASGVVLHTNLGRAPLSDSALESVVKVARGYSTLEYDPNCGKRGHRYSHVQKKLCELTGAESALVVNNNAAAVLLMLSALASGGEVVVSRGELVEIGGAFRIPEIMECCGCTLREVGATNRTHARDYENAINENTIALLKVHTSNYKIAGFTKAVSPKELAEIAHRNNLPVFEDLGSGSLLPLDEYGLEDEPTVLQAIESGIDLVTFSGDKLLGGPQAGIVVGKKEYIDKLTTHPLARAMRVDKMTLAALEATLTSYIKRTAFDDIPTLKMMGLPSEVLKQRADKLCAMLNEIGVLAEVCDHEGRAGGGSAPNQVLNSSAVMLKCKYSADELSKLLRLRRVPIVGHIIKDLFTLDVRTLLEDDFDEIVLALKEINE